MRKGTEPPLRAKGYWVSAFLVRNITKIFYATDVHGLERTFAKFVNAASLYSADVLILGGDITGKLLMPIIEEDGGWRATVMDTVRGNTRQQKRPEISRPPTYPV